MSQTEWSEKLDNQPENFTNIYINNFGKDMDEERLRELAEKFGNVLSLKVVTDKSGCPRGFGFVDFETPEQAQKVCYCHMAIEWKAMNLVA